MTEADHGSASGPPARRRQVRLSAWQQIAISVLGIAGLAGGFLACAPSPTASGSAGLPASPIDGVVVKIDSTSIGNVSGFTLRVAGGATLEMKLGSLENAAQFAPGHLAEHQATASPIRAYFVMSDGTPIVYRLEDAPAGASSSP